MKKAYICPCAGLGNRLLCLYSALYYRKTLGIKFNILWKQETACNIRFEKLFAPIAGVTVKNIYELPTKCSHPIKNQIDKIFLRSLEKKEYCYQPGDISNYYSGGGEHAIVALFDGLNEFCIKSGSSFAEWDHILAVINDIRPAVDIENFVNEIMNPYKNKTVVGVHIRRTDHVEAIANSPLSLFKEQMRECISVNPNTVFYLATDDKETEREISDEFSTITHKYFSSDKSRLTEAGMKDAYVDMLCLSKTDKILGSYGSTFSTMAAAIGGIGLEVVCL